VWIGVIEHGGSNRHGRFLLHEVQAGETLTVAALPRARAHVVVQG
jgi:hypothetical protein